MPLEIKVKSGENRGNFISRCMGDKQMRQEFPNRKQRAAVCISLFEDRYSKSIGKRWN